MNSRIVIICTGSQEDVKPFAELAKGLQAFGHSVILIAPDTSVESSSDTLSIVSSSVNIPHFVGDQITDLASTPTDLLAIIRMMRQVDYSPVLRMTDEMLIASEGAELIISHVATSIFAQSIAESLGIPFFSAVPDPRMSQRIFPDELSSSRFDFSGMYNRVTGRVSGYVLYQMFAPVVNTFRTETLKLKPHSALSYQEAGMRLQPTISATKAVIRNIPKSWDRNICVTQSWNTRQGFEQAIQAIETHTQSWKLASH